MRPVGSAFEEVGKGEDPIEFMKLLPLDQCESLYSRPRSRVN
jgi:hypothetical protein